MRILLSSLREYIDVQKTAEEIAELLTSAGIEVEHIEQLHSPSDVAFDIGLTANLGHCMSSFGIARDLAAMTGQSLIVPSWQKETFPLQGNELEIRLETNNCLRYSAVTMSDISVGPSPSWLRLRLERLGIHSVNNIVDITNLVAHEFGQPLHSFDRSRLSSNTIIVRSPKKQETIALLDDTIRTLPDIAVVIDNNGLPIALGGVMGGKESAVSESTSSLLLEAAYFSPKITRKVAKTLGIMTDSAKRFERGVNPAATLMALSYAAQLIHQVCPGAKLDGVYDTVGTGFTSRVLCCRQSQASRILGFEVSKSDLEMVFSRLGFDFSWSDSDSLSVVVPYYRHDINEEIDLIEEISRILGMRIEKEAQYPYIASREPDNALYLFARELKQRLLTEGLQEFVTCSLISPKMVEIVKNHPIDSSSVVKVLNPMSEEQSILRPTLLPGLIDVVRHNNNQRLFDITGFEIGNVHFKKGDKFIEQLVVGIILAGHRFPNHFDTSLRPIDFFDLKGIIENVMQGLQIDPHSLHFMPPDPLIPIFHTGRQATLFASKLQIGTIAELHPALLRKLGILERLFFAELNIQDLMQLPKTALRFEKLPSFPSSERDWTVTVDEAVSYEKIVEAIRSLGSPILQEISLISIFHHEKLGPNRKNISLHFVYRDLTKTVSQVEVDEEHKRIVEGTVMKIGVHSCKTQ